MDFRVDCSKYIFGNLSNRSHDGFWLPVSHNVLVFTKCSEADDVERRQGYKVRVRT